MLGDAVVTSVFIETLAKSIKNCVIDVLCNKYTEPAYRHNPLLNLIFVLDHQQNSKNLAKDFFTVRTQILSHGIYDGIFILNPCIRNYKYAAAIGARQVIARKLITKSIPAKLWIIAQGLKLTPWHLIKDLNKGAHEVMHLYNLAQRSLPLFKHQVMIPLPTVCSFYLPPDFLPQAHGIILNASGKFSQQRYLNDSMLYGLLNLLQPTKLRLAVIAAESDHDRVQQVVSSITTTSTPAVVIVENDIIGLAKIIKSYRVFIGGDGGLSHIAAGLGLACICLFDKQLSSVWHPWTPRQKSLQTPSKSIYDISVFTVLEAVREFNEISSDV